MEEDNYKIYLNKANESWVTDRFRAEWYKFNGNTSRTQILFGLQLLGLGKN